MKFNSYGYLDAGIHEMDLDAIVEHFVTAFPTSNTREDIIKGYKKHREEILALGLTCRQFIDGSFTTNKADPKDIDLVGFIDADAVDALSDGEKERLAKLFSGPQTRNTHLCDAYFVPIVPANHPYYDRLRSQRKYWMGEFGYDREDRPKGIVRTEVRPASTAPISASEEQDA